MSYTPPNIESISIVASDYIAPNIESINLTSVEGQVSVSSPSVSTDGANISGDSATMNGSISDSGGEEPTSRGFNWGTSSGNLSNSVIASNTDPFSEVINSLADGTYYFQAFATNSAGTGTGSLVSFTVDTAVAASGTDFTLSEYTPNDLETNFTLGETVTNPDPDPPSDPVSFGAELPQISVQWDGVKNVITLLDFTAGDEWRLFKAPIYGDGYSVLASSITQETFNDTNVDVGSIKYKAARIESGVQGVTGPTSYTLGNPGSYVPDYGGGDFVISGPVSPIDAGVPDLNLDPGYTSPESAPGVVNFNLIQMAPADSGQINFTLT